MTKAATSAMCSIAQNSRPTYRKVGWLFVALLLLCSVFSGFTAQAQKNLIVNGSFEEMEIGPNSVPVARGWQFFKQGEIGFLHPNSLYWKPEKNAHGAQKPYQGQASAWLKMGGRSFEASNNYGDIKRYYFQTELTEPLQKGLTYYVEAYLSFADKANCAVDAFGFYFAENRPDSTYKEYADDFVKFLVPQVAYHGPVMTDAENWTKVSGYYTANGGERWLMLGNFGLQYQFQYKLYKRRSHFFEAYYYLDAVSVIKPPLPDSLRPPDLSLPELGFAFGSAQLSALAMHALDSLGEQLKSRAFQKLRIAGHTDATGAEELNQVLSEKRALAVKDFLVQNRAFLAAKPIEVAGYGSTRPVADNHTKTGRSQNRRVEIWVVE